MTVLLHKLLKTVPELYKQKFINVFTKAYQCMLSQGIIIIIVLLSLHVNKYPLNLTELLLSLLLSSYGVTVCSQFGSGSDLVPRAHHIKAPYEIHMKFSVASPVPVKMCTVTLMTVCCILGIMLLLYYCYIIVLLTQIPTCLQQ